MSRTAVLLVLTAGPVWAADGVRLTPPACQRAAEPETQVKDQVVFIPSVLD